VHRVLAPARTAPSWRTTTARANPTVCRSCTSTCRRRSPAYARRATLCVPLGTPCSSSSPSTARPASTSGPMVGACTLRCWRRCATGHECRPRVARPPSRATTLPRTTASTCASRPPPFSSHWFPPMRANSTTVCSSLRARSSTASVLRACWRSIRRRSSTSMVSLSATGLRTLPPLPPPRRHRRRRRPPRPPPRRRLP